MSVDITINIISLVLSIALVWLYYSLSRTSEYRNVKRWYLATSIIWGLYAILQIMVIGQII